MTRAREQASELRARLESARRRGGRAAVDRDRAGRRSRCPTLGRLRLARVHVGQRRRRVLRRGLAPRRARRRARSRACSVAAIGPGTARRARRDAGMRADLVPERFVAESLLDAFPDRTAPGRGCCSRARESRATCCPKGSRRGATRSTCCPVYRTVPATPDADDARAGARRRGRRDHVHVVVDGRRTSATSSAPLAGPLPLVVSIGPVTSETARERGPARRRRSRSAHHRRPRRRLLTSAPAMPTGSLRGVSFPERRMRRLRRTPALRRLVAEHRLARRRPRRAAVREGGHRRARAGRVDAGRRAAHAGEPAQGGAGARRPRCARR